ncbi:MAG: 4-(cytidine 5'-diphospho)-2-C-methyl-D-erythritol kinase [Bacteroidetes bacterium 24-39-8]|nr:MAG: 4-(cytidine 5'-diphospho)-2-C-methyl-D-erythritol kinase [Sphingobacteriia bacterium 35-40-8]OYZ49568.1 MAG: 4-(cytidine 5'-diphospho)-2-C-methyl-D-erythritol kinase [Bacteroidetes bacterium 24-39-8]OZA63550.1 MAG: 4-(cytidine 5'-diphospho)-2-C-methyl-D-erythritol kinase [Sphingobacteriia bacterium 39-39-8]HQR93126.1 4-(cytidine 5'-diphospho)-2-C-methyl-D-erythritol kinase [Sediminibacterium sp.]HQS55458.1 4-(cytidine 5'-diphospho)-2-C-methyl-D-erythritol kinase [Sediminibacterium sp.]
MVLFPNCKINLGLHITRKRDDGYHDLETVFYPIGIKDVLEIIHSQDPKETCLFSSTGLAIQGNSTDNLCVKAYHLLKKDFPQLPPIQMHLHKSIPMGAGLGGGSADGAFALKLLNQLFHLEISEYQLIQYALELGSDCPFFILNQACIGKGRGELLEKISLDLSQYQFLIVNPGIHIGTGWAFSQITPKPVEHSLNSIIKEPIQTWKNYLSNDFEAPVMNAYPEIAKMKQALYESGALYASMSGSGSTLFGIFEKGLAPKFSFPSHYMTALVD